MPCITASGRAVSDSVGLTPQQYRVLNAQPYSYFSKAKRTFSFIPTPYGCDRIAESGLPMCEDLQALHRKWLRHTASQSQPSDHDYSGVINKTPWQHQNHAIHYAVHCPSPYIHAHMGTGKSLITVATLAACDHRRSLIICPKAVVNVWPREFRKHSRGDFTVIPLDKGTTKKKVELARKWMNADDKVAFVINYESAIQDDFASWAHSVMWDCVVADEVHKLKSPQGKASKFAADLKRGHAVGLSGTMIPHDPLDVFAQYRFLDPAIFGTSFTSFKQKYCKLGFFNEVEEFVNIQEMHDRINLICHHVSGNVLDLPPVTHVEYRFELSPKVRKAYDQFKRELIAQIQDGVVVADNVLVRGLRLQQITSGFFLDDNTGNLVVLDDRPKLNAFMEWVDSVPKGKKAVVFTRFTHDLEVVMRELEKAGFKVAELSGRKNDLTKDATYPEWADFLVANIASGGVGIDLTAASYGCYYSISWNRADYDQSIARLHRPGQTSHVTFAHLVSEETIDSDIYQAFDEGRDLVNAVLTGIKKCH